MSTDSLLDHLFADTNDMLYEQMAVWLASSRRFAAFVRDNQNKIRKKLRVTSDPDRLLDLKLELETAFLLLQERTLSVAYEPQQHGHARSPDFTVTFTTSLSFMVEVTRHKINPSADSSSVTERLSEMLVGKLGQLVPRHSNVLIVGLEAFALTTCELSSTMRSMQQHAERNDARILQRHHFGSRGEFFTCYQRLSEVLVRKTAEQPGETLVTWVNPQARHALPNRVQSALYRSQAGR
jgi:hypothetical protein